ncbi:hypothetical protein C6496_05370 [Candidatus Poribacteria bacterium]|nr:MAG: hypothetical protein C6496_05370 [Candidatus Poribacteria bacterium]
MKPLILKELRFYAHQPKYRRIQFIILCTLAFALFATAFELFALSRGRPQILVGEAIYALLIPLFFCLLLGLVVPLQVVESFQIERRRANWDLLNLTPTGHRKFLVGKLVGAVLALLWCIGLTIPLFGLSVYTGGLEIRQLLQCGLVFIVGFIAFFFIGACFTLLGHPNHAMERSYAVVLLLSFIPLIVPALTPLVSIPTIFLELLQVLSPLCVLVAIVKSDTDIALGIAPIWVWMVLYHLILSATLFGILGWRLEKQVLSA